MPTSRFVEVDGAAMFKIEMNRKVAAMMMIKKINWTKILISLDCQGTC